MRFVLRAELEFERAVHISALARREVHASSRCPRTPDGAVVDLDVTKLRHGTGGIEHRLVEIVAARRQAQGGLAPGQWTLVHQVDQPTGCGGAVEHRRRSFDHFDTFECRHLVEGEGVLLRIGLSVAQAGDTETPDEHRIVAALTAADDVADITRGLEDSVRRGVGDEFAVQHLDRVRQLDHGRVGFGGTARARGDVATVRLLTHFKRGQLDNVPRSGGWGLR